MASADIVIDRTGQPIADDWTTLPDDAQLPAGGKVIIPLARFLANSEAALSGKAGVQVGPDEHLDKLAPFLDQLALVAVDFPKFRDGRGFSHIRALREHHGFKGDIRATGHPLPDQFLLLNRCGVSSVALPQGQDPAVWAAVLALHGGLDTRPMAERPLPLLRRLAVPFET
jgi:uncharacterized protein (DUF934 family)